MMRRLLFVVALLYAVALFAWPGRVYKEFEGIGTSLEALYNATDTLTTSAFNCKSYSVLTAFVSVSAVVSSGRVKFAFEGSPDNSFWYDTGTNATLMQAGDTLFHLTNAPLFFRLKATYVSGTSITVDKVQIIGTDP